jgi:hypothetical protein
MLFEKLEGLPRIFTVWLFISLVLFSPFRYIILQLLIATAFPYQSIANFLDTFLLALYIPIVFGILYAIGLCIPLVLIILIAGTNEPASKTRLFLAGILAPIFFLCFSAIYFTILPYAGYSTHWLGPQEVMRATNGPQLYFYRYIVEPFTPLQYASFTQDIGLENMTAKERFRAHVAAVYLGDKQYRYYVSRAYPEFLGFTGALTSNSNQTDIQSRRSPFESLNSYELDKLSAVMAVAQDKPLASSDLENLRAALKSYVDRTGNYLTKNDIDHFIGLMNKSNDYQYELGQSLLFSWDNHQPYTTNRFNELYKEMQIDGYRKPELLQTDKNRIQEAAKNQNYTEDADGNKYEFGRDIIIENLAKIDITRKNFDKIVEVFNEFVK